jgi:hypothetical protein
MAKRIMNMDIKSIISLSLRGIAMAMGVATEALSILGSATIETLITLLGIGLFSISIWSLQEGGS